MKKTIWVFFALSALFMLTVSAHAAQADSDPPFAESFAPAAVENASDAETAPPVDGSWDVPVDESTYREENPASYQPPQRTPGRGEITDILHYWEDNGYPADVSYAFEAGGEARSDDWYSYWEIGLVDADEARKQEILDLASPTCLVEFKNCLFTHAEKIAAYDALTEMAVTDENILEVIFILNDDTVWVSVPGELAKEYAQYLIRDCGLGAVVSVTDEISAVADCSDPSSEQGVLTPILTPGMGTGGSAQVPSTPSSGANSTAVTGETGMVPSAPAASQPSAVFWVCVALAVAAACALTALALRRHFAPAAVTAQGGVCTLRQPLTRRKTEQAVRENAQVPDNCVYRNLLERMKAENSMTEE